MTPLLTARSLGIADRAITYTLAWSRKYRVPADDAIQTLILLHLAGDDKPLAVRYAIASQALGGVTRNGLLCGISVSLDAAYGGAEEPLGATIAATEPEDDETLPAVHKAFAWWVKRRVLTRAQAETIYRHVVLEQSLADVSRMYGLERTAAKYHYRGGMERIREAVSASG